MTIKFYTQKKKKKTIKLNKLVNIGTYVIETPTNYEFVIKFKDNIIT